MITDKALRTARFVSWAYLLLGIVSLALGITGVLGIGGSHLPFVNDVQIAAGVAWLIISCVYFVRVRKWTAQNSSNAS
jgi:hypothetical protein